MSAYSCTYIYINIFIYESAFNSIGLRVLSWI